MLDKNTLLTAAQAETGLSDFGDPSFHQPLDLLIDALNREARLNDFGQLRAQMTIHSGLVNRLKIIAYLREFPEVLDQDVPRPVFIVGLPRTGTTALHHLLNQDPANRTLRLWEAQDPVPPPETATYHSDPRIEARAAGVALTEQFLPGFLKTHLIDAEEPDECYMLLNRDFLSVEYSAMFHIPAYANWLYSNLCQRGAYESHRRQLQLLQYRHPGHWVLKAPFHQLGLREILRVYPDAIIVQTHRAPMQFVASGCSFSELLRRSGSDQIERGEIGRDWMDMLRIYTHTFEADRAAMEADFPGQFIDVYHDDFVDDPWSAVNAIYAARGTPLSQAGRSAMSEWIDAHPKGKHGRHEYRLEDYGISREEVADLFAPYMQRYGLGLD
ncbi:sulfotransferase family protein [Parahaliea aestuarii]|uniref:Sulfotransferase n=1 Tax=Parahaliea aestuarii TaxID=1852021 RepID=A0A5C8ZUT7_9GAMM|nr:sulfotransferase [Parahaliea aestuarii]TXS91524.1 sulfotransferase [Parahaliea aestuarii]